VGRWPWAAGRLIPLMGMAIIQMDYGITHEGFCLIVNFCMQAGSYTSNSRHYRLQIVMSARVVCLTSPNIAARPAPPPCTIDNYPYLRQ
jgi:hypothetical protein